MMGMWNPGAPQHGAYRYDEARDAGRLGNGVTRPKTGDILIATRHSGDCFDDYAIMRKGADTASRYRRVGRTAAYVFEGDYRVLPERTFHLACAGESVTLRLPRKITVPRCKTPAPQW